MISKVCKRTGAEGTRKEPIARKERKRIGKISKWMRNDNGSGMRNGLP